jgi:hypothetical protein
MNEISTADRRQKRNARAANSTAASGKSPGKSHNFALNAAVRRAVGGVLSDVMTLGSRRAGALWRNGLPMAFARGFQAFATKARGTAFFCLLALAAFQFPAGAAQSLTLAWDACTNANISGYNLYYGTASHSYTNKITVGNVTSGTVAGLAKGVTYYFAATAINTSGMESSLSSEISYMIPNPAILSLKAVKTNGTTTIVVTGSGGIPTRWALLGTADFNSWSAVARGTNAAVNVSIPAASASLKFFRLASE